MYVYMLIYVYICMVCACIYTNNIYTYIYTLYTVVSYKIHVCINK